MRAAGSTAAIPPLRTLARAPPATEAARTPPPRAASLARRAPLFWQVFPEVGHGFVSLAQYVPEASWAVRCTGDGLQRMIDTLRAREVVAEDVAHAAPMQHVAQAA